MDRISAERELAVFPVLGLTVTTHRVWREEETWGRKTIKTTMLENIDHCRVAYRSRPIYGILAVAFLVLGFWNPLRIGLSGPGSFQIGSVLAILLAIAYRSSRETILVIGTSSVRISLSVSGDNYDPMVDMAREIQEARDKRLQSLINPSGMPSNPETSVGLQALSNAVPR